MVRKGEFPSQSECELLALGPAGGNWEDEYYLFRDSQNTPVIWLWKAPGAPWRKGYWSREIPEAEWDSIEVDGASLRLHFERVMAKSQNSSDGRNAQ
jgi:hypothetical protein